MKVIHASELPPNEPYKPLNTQGVMFTFNRESLTLEMQDRHGAWFYEIDLERCVDSATLLDCLLQIAYKRHPLFSAAVVGDLICTLEDVAYEVFRTNLQGLYCPGGQNRRVEWKKARKR